MATDDAIVLEGVVKHFKKTARKREYTTFKSELIRLLKGDRKVVEAASHIEALKGVDLRVPKGATLGIVGRNGSGKSTLLKLITGIYTPTAGRVTVNGRISALLELGAGFHPDFTGRENILINGIILGMSRAEVKERSESIIEFAELGDFIDEPVRTYSSGMFMRLAFAVATHVDPEILIVDEILSVGDEHFQRKSGAKIEAFKKAGKTIVLVTHSLGALESSCDLAAWIDGGRTRMVGRPRDVVAEYQRAVAAAEMEASHTGHSALSRPGIALPGGADEAKVPVTLQAARLTNAQGVECSRFSAGEPQAMVMSLLVHEARETTVAYELRTGDGQVLCAGAHALGRLEPGTAEVRVRLDRPGFVGGHFLAIASLGNGVDETWGRVDCHFDVEPRERWRGPMSVDLVWERLAQPR